MSDWRKKTARDSLIHRFVKQSHRYVAVLDT